MPSLYRRLSQAHDELISTIAWSKKYDLITTGDFLGKIKLFSGSDLTPVKSEEICHDFAPVSIGIGETAPIILITNVCTETYIHSAEDGKLLKRIDAPRYEICTSSLIPGDVQFLTGSLDGGIGIWEVDSGQRVQSVQKIGAPIDSVSASADGKFLAVGSRKNKVYVLDRATLETVGKFDNHSDTVKSLSFSSDSKLLATSGYDSQTCLIDLSTMEKIAKFSTHRSWIFDVEISPDGADIATCSVDGTVALWSLSTRRCYHMFHEHSGCVVGVAYGSSPNKLASTGFDRSINVYDIK